VTGSTASLDFPIVSGFQANYGGGNQDGFIAKLNSAGTALIFSTYLGGRGNQDLVRSIALDNSGNLYVIG